MRLKVSPTPSNTPSYTPTITPTGTQCPGICFSGVGFNSLVDTILQDRTNPEKIIVVGDFTEFNGVVRQKITRIFTDGEIDYTFDSGIGFGPGGGLRAFDVIQQTDNKYVVVGQFENYRGVSRNNIVRINFDGTIDTSFVIGTGFIGIARSVIQQPDGSLIVGGQMSQYSGTPIGNICKLTSTGLLDTSFSTTAITNSIVSKITRNNDGTYYVCGAFTMTSGGRSGIILLNADGTYNPSLPFNASGVGSFPVLDFEILPDGKLICVGDFGSYNGFSINRIVRLNPDGTRDLTFNPPVFGFQNYVYEVIVQGSKYICIGFFNAYGLQPVERMARINPDGSLDTTFFTGDFAGGSEDQIIHLYQITGNTNDAGYFFVGGFFDSYDGVLTSNIVKLDRNGYAVDCDPILVSPTPTSTQTRTPTPTNTSTPTQTPTNTETPTQTPTPTPTNTSTQTQTPTQTNTPSPTCACLKYELSTSFTNPVYTYTDCDGTIRNIQIGFFSTFDICALSAPTGGFSTFLGCCNIVPTPPPTNSATRTPTPTSTPTNTTTGTPTQTPTQTQTSTQGVTPTPTNTSTPTSTTTNTLTATPTNTGTPTQTPTQTQTGTSNITPTSTSTPTQTPSGEPEPECISYNVQGEGFCEYEDCDGTPQSFFCDTFCNFTICTNGVISSDMTVTDVGSC